MNSPTLQPPSSAYPYNVLVVCYGHLSVQIVQYLTELSIFNVTACVLPRDSCTQSLLDNGKCTIVKTGADTVQDIILALKGHGHFQQAVISSHIGSSNLEITRNWIDAVEELNVSFLVFMSVSHASLQNTVWSKHFWELEQYLCSVTIDSCILRSQYVMENWLLHADEIKSKRVLSLPLTSRGYFAPIAGSDVARAVLVILADSSHHIGQTLDITGPQTKNGYGIAKAISKALHIEIEYNECSINETKHYLKTVGLDKSIIEGFASFYQAVNHSEMHYATSDFLKLTGEYPMSIQEYISENLLDYTESLEE